MEIPTVAIIKFEGDKLVHEHIYWDQATVLVQLGLLEPTGLPIAGVETARKVEDKSLRSNALMTRWKESPLSLCETMRGGLVKSQDCSDRDVVLLPHKSRVAYTGRAVVQIHSIR